MFNFAIYAMVYLGSALMVFNIISYVRYARRVQELSDWGSERRSLYIPIVLLVLFLIGYLAVGIFGKPDLIVSGILFGGSIFVFTIFQLLQSITEHIRENEHLQMRLMAAEQSNLVKASFLSSVSHEMRSPMNAIIGLDALALKEPELPGTVRDKLEKIDASAKYLLGLIENILDMNDMESGSASLREEPFSIGETLDTVNAIIGSQCVFKGLKYECHAEDVINMRCVGDTLRLRQALFNILENAVKFTPAHGKVTFRAEALAQTDERCTLRFIISDNGPGIDEAFMPHLFDAFTQEDATTTNRYGGSGLGLAISKRILDLMGGEIAVDSKKNVGSTFTVTVPLRVAEEEPLPEEALAEEAVDGAEVLHGRRVLVAEDIDINAEIVMDLLDLEKASSERAENGQIAVDMFAASAPGYYDAILMDLRMPVMDGLDATRAIRAMNRPDSAAIPIVALTANAFEEDVRRALEAGMDVHLAKPADSDMLYQTLGSLIARRERAQQASDSAGGRL